MKLITELLNIELPFIQGAMAQISRAPLVGAVSEAGGLGVIASGGMSAKQVRQEIRDTKMMTDKPFGVNVMLMMPNCDEIIDVIIEEGVKIITTGAGTPKRYMKRLKEHDIVVIPVVPSVLIAKKMEELGVDAIIAEGCEAGGHIGEVSTLPLVTAIVREVSLPVIAAGGIATGQGVAAVLALGAVGVQMGTVYLSSEECPVSDEFKEKIIVSSESSTVVTGRNVGAPVRTIRNNMTDRYLELEKEDISRDELEKLTIGSLQKAVHEGDVDNGSVMAGQAVGTISEIRSVEQIHFDILKEYKSVVLPIL